MKNIEIKDLMKEKIGEKAETIDQEMIKYMRMILIGDQNIKGLIKEIDTRDQDHHSQAEKIIPENIEKMKTDIDQMKEGIETDTMREKDLVDKLNAMNKVSDRKRERDRG